MRDPGVVAERSDCGDHRRAQGLGFCHRGTIHRRRRAGRARDVNLETTEVAAKQLGGADVALAVRCDVTQAADVETLIQTAVERFGGLDIMVNNAGSPATPRCER